MDESTTLSIKDRYIAAVFCILLLIAYMILAIMTLNTGFLENILLVMIGVLGGLLKSSSTNTTVERSNLTKVGE